MKVASEDHSPEPTIDQLSVWIDRKVRSAPGQMAMDESLFEEARKSGSAFIRFYEFSEPALTIGYFDAFPSDESQPVVRRITGGGLVEHGDDLTICLVTPPGTEVSRMATGERYRWFHQSVRDSMAAFGFQLQFEESAQLKTGPCFSNPVKWDLLNKTGQKIVGGAQRNSRGVVIHQGSAKIPPQFRLGGELEDWMLYLADQVCRHRVPLSAQLKRKLESISEDLLRKKYKTDKWNKKW